MPVHPGLYLSTLILEFDYFSIKHFCGCSLAVTCTYMYVKSLYTVSEKVTFNQTYVKRLYYLSQWSRLNKLSYNQTQKFQKRFLFLGVSSIFLKPRLEARVSVTQKQYATICNPKMYPYTKFWIPTSHNIQILSGLYLYKTVA